MVDEEKKVTEGSEEEMGDGTATGSEEEIGDGTSTGSEDMDTEQQEEEETVPLATYLELKKKYKESKKVNAAYEEKALDSDLIGFKNVKLAEYTALGFTEEQAEKLVSDLLEAKKEIQKHKYTAFEQNIIEEIEDLEAEFEDIGDYQGAIVDKIKELKKAGHQLDVADAYMLVRRQTNSKKDLKDRKINDIQANVINRKKGSPSNRAVVTGQSSVTKNKYPLDADDKKALAALQKMQPNSKWDAAKYYRMVKQVD